MITKFEKVTNLKMNRDKFWLKEKEAPHVLYSERSIMNTWFILFIGKHYMYVLIILKKPTIFCL